MTKFKDKKKLINRISSDANNYFKGKIIYN